MTEPAAASTLLVVARDLPASGEERLKSPHPPRVRGSGLRLAFCKLPVDARRGLVPLRSRKGEGSEVQIMLAMHPLAAGTRGATT